MINGAQTIASSAKFVADNPGADISSAKVSITLIKADADGEFGKQVEITRDNTTIYGSDRDMFIFLADEENRIDHLREFVEQQVRDKSYTSSSEYLRQLIREHREIERFRELIDEGANSPIVGVFDQSYFDDLKRSIRKGRIE